MTNIKKIFVSTCLPDAEQDDIFHIFDTKLYSYTPYLYWSNLNSPAKPIKFEPIFENGLSTIQMDKRLHIRFNRQSTDVLYGYAINHIHTPKSRIGLMFDVQYVSANKIRRAYFGFYAWLSPDVIKKDVQFLVEMENFTVEDRCIPPVKNLTKKLLKTHVEGLYVSEDYDKQIL